MPTGPYDVRLQGMSGSSRPTAKVTRLTHNGRRSHNEPYQIAYWIRYDQPPERLGARTWTGGNF